MSKVCTWTEDDEGVWQTDCGEAFFFNDGTPEENTMKFCCWCGAELQQVLYEDTQDGSTRQDQNCRGDHPAVVHRGILRRIHDHGNSHARLSPCR